MKRLFYYSTAWCVPCQTLGPIMDQVAATIPVEKINVDYTPDATTRYGIKSVPTVVLVENDQEVKRFTGAHSMQQVIDFYNGKL